MFNLDKVDKQSLNPAYHQIYNIIKNQIDNDILTEGEFLPSESSLCKIFGTSKITVRNALKKLQDIGYIKKEQGKKAYVTKYNNKTILVDFKNLTTDLRREDLTLKSLVMTAEFIKPSAKIAKVLNLNKGEEVFCLERVRSINGTEVVYSVSYLKRNEKINYEKINFEPDTSLKKILNDNGVQFKYCDETLEAQIPEENVKKHLKLDHRTAVFYRERVTYDQSGMPFEFVVNYYNGKYYKYFIEKGDA